MPFKIVLDDITKMNTKAIVNSANEYLIKGGGVCKAIFDAADDIQLEIECASIGHCPIGHAVATKGYQLKAKYIIHACGPVYNKSNVDESEKMLRSAYRSSLELADKLEIESIAFPLISSGIYGYPRKEAFRIASDEISSFVKTKEMMVYLVLYDKTDYVSDRMRFSKIDQFIKSNYDPQKEIDIRNESNRKWIEKDFSVRYRIEPPKERKRDINKIKHEVKIEHNEEDVPISDIRYARSLDDIFKNMEETFSLMLLRLINEKGKDHTEVYKKANIDRRLFSKIKNNKNYIPKKQTVIAFAIALELSLDETNDLLLKAGYALSMSSKFDVIIMYHIKNEIYDIFDINEVLFSYDQLLLGA